MRILQTLVAIFIFSLFFCPNCFANQPDEKLHLQCLYPTIHLSPDSGKNYGTGFIVRSSKISDSEYINVFITAAHVTNPVNQYTVTVFEYEDWSVLKRGQPYAASIYAVNFDLDIAIGMFISDEKMPVAKIDMDTKFYIGNEVFRVGCGLGDDPRLDYGKITSLCSKISGSASLRTSVHSVPGDSGGALFSNYKVVGVLKSIRAMRSGQLVFNMSYYTPISSLREWSEEDGGAYDFTWKEKAFPRIIFWELRFTRDHIITKVVKTP